MSHTSDIDDYQQWRPLNLNPVSDYGAKPRIDEGHRGMQYGQIDYDRGPPHPRPIRDPFNEKTSEDIHRIRKEQFDMDEDIKRMKEKQLRERREQEMEKKKKKETDLFLDTLGGPAGTVVRQNGSPALADSRSRLNMGGGATTPYRSRMTPAEVEDYREKLDRVSEEKRMAQHQRRMDDLRKQIDHMKNETGMEKSQDEERYSPYVPTGMQRNQRKQEQRSLDLENTRGGAGAPFKDNTGRNVTRRPITLSVNDYGDHKIKEDVPGKSTFELLGLEEKPYHPWGAQGSGAPIRDRDGNVRTQIYGKLEDKHSWSGDVRRKKRGQEVLYNDLKEVARQQKENKEEFQRYMKAPQADLAEMLMQGRVGKPKRNEITGEIDQHHLPQSDVVKTYTNYQPKGLNEKQEYHNELARAAEDRRNQRMLEHMKEKQEANAHFQNMDKTWGNFGGGAPKHSSIRKKANLTNSLFYPDEIPEPHRQETPPFGTAFYPQMGQSPRLGYGQQSPQLGYNKLYLDRPERQQQSSDNSPRYVKTTMNSSHKNMFEAPNEKRFIRGTPQALAPYATSGEIY